MDNGMICASCVCGCLVLPYSCLYDRDSRLQDMALNEKPQLINYVNSFILIGTGNMGGVLGQACFTELCTAIKDAEAQASAYREEFPDSENQEAEFWYYLENDSPNWYLLLRNDHFQNLYAAYCMYYFFATDADSETTKDGQIKHKRAGDKNNGSGSENITHADSNSKASVQLNIAQSFGAIFRREFMLKNWKKYSCLPSKGCGCYQHYSCGCSVNNDFPEGGYWHNGTYIYDGREFRPNTCEQGVCDNKIKVPRKPRSTAV